MVKGSLFYVVLNSQFVEDVVEVLLKVVFLLLLLQDEFLELSNVLRTFVLLINLVHHGSQEGPNIGLARLYFR